MKLRKQLFAAFLSVAILPLVVVGVYMFASNLMLAFNLYEQNLQNSTEIQTDLVEENINRLMVRSRRFASSRAVKEACLAGFSQKLSTEEKLSEDILNFTDETLDNVAIFALVGQDETLLYSSGSNSDTTTLTTILPELQYQEEQSVREIAFGEQGSSLLIVTPIMDNMQMIGKFLVVCQTDYFLRIISSHKQLESTNAIIYCKDHHKTVVSKLDSLSELPKLDQQLEFADQGAVFCHVNTGQSLLYYRTISKTPWVLANTIPIEQIYSRVWDFGLINVIIMFMVFLIILFLSKCQSKRMLMPLEKLLDAVELFFVSGAKKFHTPELDHETEIGYLAEKFSGISKEFSISQGCLRESTYLYNTLLQATYEFCLTIDLPSDIVHCNLEPLAKRLLQPEGVCVSERVLVFLTNKINTRGTEADILRNIVYGRLTEPVEVVVCCDMGKHREEVWFHIIAVSIVGSEEIVEKVVLHFEDITKEKHEEFRLIRSSQLDPLCGLLNKTAFPQHCQLSEPGKTDVVFFIDLDSFKQVNDTLGHTIGDEVLVAAAEAIKGQFRSGDAIGRFGGDEFVVFAPGMSQNMAEQRAEALVKALSFFKASSSTQLHVTASVGVCIVRQPMDLMQAIQLADKVMYQAKENGKSQYFIV